MKKGNWFNYMEVTMSNGETIVVTDKDFVKDVNQAGYKLEAIVAVEVSGLKSR